MTESERDLELALPAQRPQRKGPQAIRQTAPGRDVRLRGRRQGQFGSSMRRSQSTPRPGSGRLATWRAS